MANIHTVLEAVVDNGTSGKKVQLGVVDRNEYETVRTRLVTLWSEQRDVIRAVTDDDPLADCSLCGDYDPATGSGLFYLGKPRRKLAKSYSFAIVDVAPPTPPTIPEPANDESIDSRAAE